MAGTREGSIKQDLHSDYTSQTIALHTSVEIIWDIYVLLPPVFKKTLPINSRRCGGGLTLSEELLNSAMTWYTLKTHWNDQEGEE